MTEHQLTIAPNVALPPDAALGRFVVVGKSGAGKSNGNVVMAEEFVRCGIPTWALDPLGNLWGLRSSLDGERAGLPVVIFGGQHGDAPLNAGDDRRIARIVAGEKISALLDLSDLDIEEQRDFAEAFCDELLAIAKRSNLIGHLLIDEADRFVPNAVGFKKGAVKRFARTARNFSIGWTFSTQRIQLLSPEVIESANVIIAMKMPSGLAKDRLGTKLEGAFDTKAATTAMLNTLPTLKKGEAWFVPDSDWLHGDEDAVPFRFRFRWRETFDSTQVRRIGADVVEPKVLADIDLDKIREALEISEEEPEDQSERIAALQRQVDDLQEQLEQRPEAEIREIVLFSDADRAQLSNNVMAIGGLWERIHEQAEEVLKRIADVVERIDAFDYFGNRKEHEDQSVGIATRREGNPAPERPRAPRTSGNGALTLSKAERSILSVLAQYPTGRSKVQIAILAGYAVDGGGFRNALGSLNTKGYINVGDTYKITPDGRAAAGKIEPLPTGRALLDYWISRLPKAAALSLKVIANNYPRRIAKEEVARLTGYEPTGGGFRNALGRLRTLELIAGTSDLRAADALCERNPHA